MPRGVYLTLKQMPGVRCPTCAANGSEVWVIPGKRCHVCDTMCNSQHSKWPLAATATTLGYWANSESGVGIVYDAGENNQLRLSIHRMVTGLKMGVDSV